MREVCSEHGVLCPVLHRARGRAGGAVTRPHLHPGEWNSIVYPSPRNTGAFFGHCATSRRFVASSSMYHTRLPALQCIVSPHLEVAAVEERLTEVEILRRNMAPVSLQTVSINTEWCGGGAEAHLVAKIPTKWSNWTSPELGPSMRSNLHQHSHHHH